MKQVEALKVNLNSIDGDGEFPCPSCGATISPDDDSEKSYKIIDIETFKDGSLKTLTISCKKCHNTIIVEGFELLNNLENKA
jgi:ribosomal protein S27E